MLAEPRLHIPEFSWTAMLELVVPLAITVLVVQNGQGIAVLNGGRARAADQRHRGRLRRGLDRQRPRRDRVDVPDWPRQRHHLGQRRAARRSTRPA